MRWRKISEAEVEKTLVEPEEIEDSIKGRKNAFKHMDQKWLKVTFKEESNQFVVVTTIDKNR
jgi:hypothetical protein